ncbi:NADP-dependent oxidoreductase [Streptomyces sp. NBC_00053]|uniref:NADP-dependent oxidoreductase n=1 Tax=unclassified Streptomyces TaxID=2593676 RepID=UPI000F5B8E5F|nr:MULTISPECIES: NADP-dependent oxidoreductase [unclassified Streptomyces]WSG55516.1 NADP-dependent oxidoreductase [Streptomyces sp. NBC_01732]WSX06655.1 NADP-dependent oxidoreductase [Streptomyces sp. NBC_00987]MCX5165357.1 NADP-dependent oxidoreductase [Streptomyces sp. NBC_00305]MCX5223881.1 NADP-dependent oxidoreductase [Streptomyces sp. NBC_00264]MCX5498003.1 NADP-dependent oxidoreductase [Streptomyces sp. NBC_00052]
MRAVFQKSFGGPEVLEIAETERPKPLPGEVLVKVHASAVNPVDVFVRSGAFPLLGEPPFGVGWDISGVVEEAGPGARFEVGDEVYGMPFFPRAATGYAEYVAAPSRQVARKPASLDHVHAAAIPLAALTAWQGLVQAAGVKAGDRVLIHRAAGGVGHFAVQIAKAHGAHVIAMASPARHDFVRGLGANEVIDYRTTDFTEAVKDADVVFDSTAQGDLSLGVLRPGGVLISIVEHADPELAVRVEAAGRRFAGISVEPDYAALEAIADLVDAGLIRPHVEETFPLEEAGKAHELVASGHVRGKIVLTV